MRARLARRGSPPSWKAIVKATLGWSLVSVIGAAATAWGRDPNPVALMPGAVVVVTMLFGRVRIGPVIYSAFLAAILAGPVWIVFNSLHAARWALVGMAGLCPIAAVAIAWLLTLINPGATLIPGPSAGAPPLPADLVQRQER